TRSPISIGRPRGSASVASSSGMNRTRDRRAEVPRSTHDRRRVMPRPSPAEYAPYYGQYVELVPEDDVLAALQAQLDDVLALLRAAPEAEGPARHPPYTWSVKEVVGHMTDTERVFGYRALRFARGDATPLPGFDENAYARAADSDRRPLAALVAEFE